jgi:hypothetical protein
MGVLDLLILASMSLLVVFFATVAVLEWRETRAGRSQGADAHVIEHPRADRRVNPAA